MTKKKTNNKKKKDKIKTFTKKVKYKDVLKDIVTNMNNKEIEDKVNFILRKATERREDTSKKRIICIGDINGHFKALVNLLFEIEANEPRASNDEIIFVGNYIGYGPESSACLSLVREYQKEAPDKVKLLRGVHEQYLYRGFNSGNLHKSVLPSYPKIVYKSYSNGMLNSEIHRVDAELVKKDREFVSKLPTNYINKGFYFASAGIDPNRPLQEQSMWANLYANKTFLEFNRPYPGHKVVIHGTESTVSDSVDIRSNRFNLNTQAFGYISAILLDDATSSVIREINSPIASDEVKVRTF